MVSNDDLDQLQNPRLDQPLEIFILLLIIFAGVMTVYIDLNEDGEGAKEVDLLANLR